MNPAEFILERDSPDPDLIATYFGSPGSQNLAAAAPSVPPSLQRSRRAWSSLHQRILLRTLAAAATPSTVSSPRHPSDTAHRAPCTVGHATRCVRGTACNRPVEDLPPSPLRLDLELRARTFSARPCSCRDNGLRIATRSRSGPLRTHVAHPLFFCPASGPFCAKVASH